MSITKKRKERKERHLIFFKDKESVLFYEKYLGHYSKKVVQTELKKGVEILEIHSK